MKQETLNPEPKESRLSMMTKDIKDKLLETGFALKKTDPACVRNIAVSGEAFTKKLGYAFYDRPVTVYIYKSGIGIDINYKEGRNYINNFWSFSKCKNFDDAFRRMIHFANDYLDNKISGFVA